MSKTLKGQNKGDDFLLVSKIINHHFLLDTIKTRKMFSTQTFVCAWKLLTSNLKKSNLVVRLPSINQF